MFMFSFLNFFIQDAVQLLYVQFFPEIRSLFGINSVPESGLPTWAEKNHKRKNIKYKNINRKKECDAGLA
jgi:hypothetical protein